MKSFYMVECVYVVAVQARRGHWNLELELYAVVSFHMGSGTQSRVLCKNSKSS